jgi:hypothetical protein
MTLTMSGVLLIGGFTLIAVAAFFTALTLGLAVLGIECIAVGYLLEQRARVAPSSEVS